MVGSVCGVKQAYGARPVLGTCHPERSEGSPQFLSQEGEKTTAEILRFAQDDKVDGHSLRVTGRIDSGRLRGTES
jgi:hypothetical protein